MKNIIRNTVAAAAIIVLSSSVVLANKKNAVPASQAGAEPTVSYVTSNANSSLFLVNYNAGANGKFELSVQNENGDAIYRQYFETESFSKYVKLVNEGDEDAKFTFQVRNLATGEVHNFDVSSNVKLVRNVFVVKQ